jgi:hypothetical protein
MPNREAHSARQERRAILGRLMPFNECRFDDCMAYLAGAHRRPLGTYEMMKLHVMIDVYHTLDRGKPAIGGAFWPFTNGPVARAAKSRVRHWESRYEKTGAMPDGFMLKEEGGRLVATPVRVPDCEDFSAAELDAMERAWRDVIGPLDAAGGFSSSQEFFHKDSFIGRAWEKARQRGSFLDWNEIIDEYDAATGEDHSHIKLLLRY